MSDRWQDYTLRYHLGQNKVAHLASKSSPYTACRLELYDSHRASEQAPLCKGCLRAIEAAKRREQAAPEAKEA